jgi:hypothetical protein
MFPMLFNQSLVNTLDLKMADKDFSQQLPPTYLGGDFNNYLNMNLREEERNTAGQYGASTVIGAGKYVSN